jgi:hypothetical protein
MRHAGHVTGGHLQMIGVEHVQHAQHVRVSAAPLLARHHPWHPLPRRRRRLHSATQRLPSAFAQRGASEAHSGQEPRAMQWISTLPAPFFAARCLRVSVAGEHEVGVASPPPPPPLRLERRPRLRDADARIIHT